MFLFISSMLFMMILKVDPYEAPQKTNKFFAQLNNKNKCSIGTVLNSKLNPEADVFRSQRQKRMTLY